MIEVDQLTQVDSIQRRLLINFDLNLLISSSFLVFVKFLEMV